MRKDFELYQTFFCARMSGHSHYMYCLQDESIHSDLRVMTHFDLAVLAHFGPKKLYKKN